MSVEPEIRTAAGVVRGRWENAIAVFRGVPYAEPPVGSRRFGAPIPVQRWDGVRDALEFGPPVPQASNAGAVMSSVSGSVRDGSADCLTLNVWSPDLGAVRLPVMVWIQGGTYLQNNSANPHCDGATLAGSGVVLVSMNYRVGADGFARIAGARTTAASSTRSPRCDGSRTISPGSVAIQPMSPFSASPLAERALNCPDSTGRLAPSANRSATSTATGIATSAAQQDHRRVGGAHRLTRSFHRWAARSCWSAGPCRKPIEQGRARASDAQRMVGRGVAMLWKIAERMSRGDVEIACAAPSPR